MDKVMNVFGYFFRPVEERGRVLPFSRFDILLSIVLAVALMAAISYSVEPSLGWTKQRAALFTVVVLVVNLFAQHRQIVLGCAAGIIAGRFLVGLLFGNHPLVMVLGVVVCGTMAWWLLRSCN
jgi:hypothetical protein